MNNTQERKPRWKAWVAGRRGVVTVLAAFSLAAVFAFVAFAVDTGLITVTQTNMQNAVDAAALAASQEITGAIHAAGEGNGPASIDANSIAVAQARQIAAEVALANGVEIDPDTDVEFGKRVYDESTHSWPIQWGATPYNVVRVTARKNNPDPDANNAKLKLAFGWAVGKSKIDVIASATAFVEARDLVLVLDFSGSMNDDSSIRSFSTLGQSNVEDSLDAMWDALVAADPRWPNKPSKSKFPSTGFGKVNSYAGTYYNSSTTSSIISYLELDQTTRGGSPKNPFPQSGKSGDNYNNFPSASASLDRWEDYVNYVKNLSGPYRRRYGYRTLMDFLQEQRYYNHQSEDLWRTPHYPFHAVKEGATLFCNFLEDLDFSDQLGLVSYATYSQRETTLNEVDAVVDISDDPITEDYALIDAIQRHKQAAHYANNTGMGYGLKEARKLLLGDGSTQGHVRYGSRPTIILMTDGLANQSPSGWSPPSGWSWSQWTDFNDDGSADYYTNDSAKKYAFWEATEAIRRGVIVHTMSVGAGADRDLMQAIAKAGGGTWINVPGGSTVQEMESQMLIAFGKIAAKVPPPKLVYGGEEE